MFPGTQVYIPLLMSDLSSYALPYLYARRLLLAKLVVTVEGKGECACVGAIDVFLRCSKFRKGAAPLRRGQWDEVWMLEFLY